MCTILYEVHPTSQLYIFTTEVHSLDVEVPDVYTIGVLSPGLAVLNISTTDIFSLNVQVLDLCQRLERVFHVKLNHAILPLDDLDPFAYESVKAIDIGGPRIISAMQTSG